MKAHSICLVAVALAAIMPMLAAACTPSGESDRDGSRAPLSITPVHSSLEIYTVLADARECVGGGDSLYAPAWVAAEQIWAAPCANEDASKSRCLLVKDDTLELESKALEGSICRGQ
jgi:hypothetical protein